MCYLWNADGRQSPATAKTDHHPFDGFLLCTLIEHISSSVQHSNTLYGCIQCRRCWQNDTRFYCVASSRLATPCCL